ncbi:MAG: FkbM family methyltransferase [Melioribacteraceae bacterium]|nr:FkbM family methyltransferase [Melioribacteraceae bacterium]
MRLFIEEIFRLPYKILINKNYRYYLYLLIKYGSQKRYEQKTIKFRKYKITIADSRSFIAQYRDIFVEEDYKFLCNSPNPIIIDAGSNIGISILYFVENYKSSKIIGFEADNKIFEILKSNIEQNRINKVELINKAVWIHNEGVYFSSEGADGSAIVSDKNSSNVASIKLSSFLMTFSKIDLLKIDIEGAEIDVIKDCENSLLMVDNLFIEYHSFKDGQQSLSEILRVLEKNNFRYYIKEVNKRSAPFINKEKSSSEFMDVQLNIYGYKYK